MHLKEWMRKNKVSNQDLAEKTGHHRSTISKFRNGTRVPKIPDAMKIEKATKGAVTIQSFNPKTPKE